MTAGRWALGLVCLACIWLAPYLGSRRLVRRLVPGAAGPPALLASLVLALTMITVVSEVLGSAGQFARWPLVAGCLLAGSVAARAGRPGPARGPWPRPDRATVMAGGLAVAVAARWAIGSGVSLRSGIFTTDSIQYHLPFAATFAQTGWLSRLHYAWLDPVWTFYPYGSEILHSIGMAAFGSDVLSPVLNLGWMAIALLAAWCCGARWKAGPLTLALGGVVLALPMLTLSQPGSANADAAAVALVLSAVALFFTVGDRSGGYLLAGLAAGLAAGTTLYALPPIAGLAAGALIFDRRRVPGKFRLGALGLLLGGSYWYLRNLVQLGNPVPGFKLGPLHLPSPGFPIVTRYGFSVAHYLPHGWFWTHYVRPGLHLAFGPGWPIVAAFSLAGAVACFTRLVPSVFRPVCLGSAVAAVVYVVTPTSAYGPAGDPFLFSANLRFLLPPVAWLLVSGGVLLSNYRPRWLEQRISRTGSPQTLWVGLTVVFGLVTLAYPHGADRAWSTHPQLAVIGAAAALAAVGLAAVSRRDIRALGGAALVVVVVLGGLPLAASYANRRYAGTGPIDSWARTTRGAMIGTIAFPRQYPLFGAHLDNRVSYVGSAGSDGSLNVATTCRQWRRQLVRGGYDFVVIGADNWTSAPIPQLGWTESDPAARAVVTAPRGGPGPQGVVFRLGAGSGTTAGC